MIFIDSSAWIAYYRKEDAHNPEAVEIFKEIEGSEERVYTSDYIFDETVTVAMARTEREKAVKLGQHILESSHVMQVQKHVFRDAWKLFRKDEKGLSFTDCTNIALMELLGIQKIASFDTGFEGKKSIELINKEENL